MTILKDTVPISSVLRGLEIGKKAQFPIEKINSVTVIVNRMNITDEKKRYTVSRNVPGRYVAVTRLR